MRYEGACAGSFIPTECMICSRPSAFAACRRHPQLHAHTMGCSTSSTHSVPSACHQPRGRPAATTYDARAPLLPPDSCPASPPLHSMVSSLPTLSRFTRVFAVPDGQQHPPHAVPAQSAAPKPQRVNLTPRQSTPREAPRPPPPPRVPIASPTNSALRPSPPSSSNILEMLHLSTSSDRLPAAAATASSPGLSSSAFNAAITGADSACHRPGTAHVLGAARHSA